MLNTSDIRKYLSTILLLFFLFNIGGYYLWFFVIKYSIQNEVRQEIEKGISDKDLTLVAVPVNNESEICWIKSGKEFSWHGEMYDVVKAKIRDNMKYYYCIRDKKEKRLITDFNKARDSQKKAEKIFKKVINQQYFTRQANLFQNIYCSDFLFKIIHLNFKSHISDILTPPPNIV